MYDYLESFSTLHLPLQTIILKSPKTSSTTKEDSIDFLLIYFSNFFGFIILTILTSSYGSP